MKFQPFATYLVSFVCLLAGVVHVALVVRRGTGVHQNYQTHVKKKVAFLEKDDIILNPGTPDPLVIEEYNLVFFRVAKCASSEWIRFFMRLEGNENWCGNNNIHPRETNKLKTLSDYPLEEAQKMMTSSNWTKAIFVRNPKPRLLSAFLDKCIQFSERFVKNACRTYAKRKTGQWEQSEFDLCRDLHGNFDFFLKNITTVINEDRHFRSSSSFVDEKWWPYINYIATMENLSSDAEDFLKTIVSNKDGLSAWDRIGKTGWSDHLSRSCDTSRGDHPFLGIRPRNHKTNSNEKMLEYYTYELEKYVEDKFSDDYNSRYFHFKNLQLFEEDEEKKK